MATPLYKITFEGQLLAGVEQATAIRDLAVLFEASEAAVAQLFGGRKLALKRHLLLEDTHKFVPMLEKAGIQTRVEDDTPFAPAGTQPLAGGATYDDTVYSPWTTPVSSNEQSYTAVASNQKLLSLEGRMGRINFAACSMVIGLIALFSVSVFLSTFTNLFGSTLSAALFGAAYLAASVVIGVRRLHDLNWSGWLIVLSAVPYVGVMLTLLLTFMPGTAGSNRYGPQPAPASTLAKALLILAGIGLVVTVVGLVWFFDTIRR